MYRLDLTLCEEYYTTCRTSSLAYSARYWASSAAQWGENSHWCLPVELPGNVAPELRRLLYRACVHLLILPPVLEEGVGVWRVHRRLHVMFVRQCLLL